MDNQSKNEKHTQWRSKYMERLKNENPEKLEQIKHQTRLRRIRYIESLKNDPDKLEKVKQQRREYNQKRKQQQDNQNIT